MYNVFKFLKQCREFLALEYVFIIYRLFRNQSDDYLYFIIRKLHNIHLYLCWQLENAKLILCNRKIGVKCAYLRFLLCKYLLNCFSLSSTYSII